MKGRALVKPLPGVVILQGIRASRAYGPTGYVRSGAGVFRPVPDLPPRERGFKGMTEGSCAYPARLPTAVVAPAALVSDAILLA